MRKNEQDLVKIYSSLEEKLKERIDKKSKIKRIDILFEGEDEPPIFIYLNNGYAANPANLTLKNILLNIRRIVKSLKNNISGMLEGIPDIQYDCVECSKPLVPEEMTEELICKECLTKLEREFDEKLEGNWQGGV